MRYQLDSAMSKVDKAHANEARYNRHIDSLSEKQRQSEKVAASARTTQGARLDAASKEKELALLAAQKAEEALVEQRGQYTTAKEELRGAQERLKKEKLVKEKMAIASQRQQLQRVLNIPRPIALGACIYKWRMVLAVQDTMHEYYHAALAAGGSGGHAQPREDGTPPVAGIGGVLAVGAGISGRYGGFDELNEAWERGREGVALPTDALAAAAAKGVRSATADPSDGRRRRLARRE